MAGGRARALKAAECDTDSSAVAASCRGTGASVTLRCAGY